MRLGADNTAVGFSSFSEKHSYIVAVQYDLADVPYGSFESFVPYFYQE